MYSLLAAIAQTLQSQSCASGGVDSAAHDSISDSAADFVIRQIKRLPLYQRGGVWVLALAFAAHAYARRHRAFAKQLANERAQQIMQWRSSRLRLCSQFILLCEGLVCLVEYER